MRTVVVVRSIDGQHYMEDPNYEGTAYIPRKGEQVKGYDEESMPGIWEVVNVVHCWARRADGRGHGCLQAIVWVKPGVSE